MGFCKGFGGKAKRFFKSIDKYVADNSALALSITREIAAIVGSDMVDVITKITKTTVDDVARVQVLKALEYAIDTLEVIEACKGTKNMEDKVKCFAKELGLKSPAMREAILIKLASLVTKKLDGHRFKQSVYDAIVQGQFTSNKMAE